jgi:hypothetical protein
MVTDGKVEYIRQGLCLRLDRVYSEKVIIMKEKNITELKPKKDKFLIRVDLNIQDKGLFSHFLAVLIHSKVILGHHSFINKMKYFIWQQPFSVRPKGKDSSYLRTRTCLNPWKSHKLK